MYACMHVCRHAYITYLLKDLSPKKNYLLRELMFLMNSRLNLLVTTLFSILSFEVTGSVFADFLRGESYFVLFDTFFILAYLCQF